MRIQYKVMTITLALCSALYGAETKNVDRTLPLRSNGTVTLEAHNGTVTVHTWDRAEIEIHARIEAGGNSSEDHRRFTDTTVEIEGSSDFVKIRSKTPDYSNGWSFLSWGNWGNGPTIDYTVNAPRNARWTLRNHNSKVEIYDLNAALDVETHNGSIRVDNLGGPLELSMHNGDARIDFASFTHESRINTHNGSVELTLPKSTKFDLHSDGHNLTVNSDFPVMTQSSRRWGSNFNGPVNGGGPALRIDSHNGHFRLRAK